MPKWLGYNIEEFPKRFDSGVTMDGGLTLNNTLNYGGTDGNYLVISEGNSVGYRTVANIRTDIGGASDSRSGLVELATTAETTTGTDTTRAVTPDGLKDGYQGSTNVDTLGTITTGTWQGTAIATNQQNHLTHYRFAGYGTTDGTNYEAPEILSDQNAPFEHNTSYGSDGLTAQEPRQFLKSGGYIMPYNGTLKRWQGWASCAGTSGTITIGLFKASLTRNSTGTVTPVLLKSTAFTPLGNTRLEDFAETSFSVSFSAGDIIYSAVHADVSKNWWMNSTLEIEWEI